MGLDSENIKELEFNGIEDSNIDQMKEIISQAVDKSENNVEVENVKILINLPK